jgi:hypothetical protein
MKLYLSLTERFNKSVFGLGNPLKPEPNAMKNCRVSLEITLHFVTLEIKAY